MIANQKSLAWNILNLVAKPPASLASAAPGIRSSRRLKEIAEKLRESSHTHAKAAKASLDGSCRCVLRGGTLRRAGVERRASSYLDALPSMRRQVALPMCRTNDPRLL